VAVVALALGYRAVRWRLDGAALAYRRRAEHYVGRYVEQGQAVNVLVHRLEERSEAPDPEVYEAFVRAKRRYDRFRSLAVKYYFASSRPWLRVAPDPPGPD
jgi:hypothetical protein